MHAFKLRPFLANSTSLLLVLLIVLDTSNAYGSCGSTACSINTNWNEHGLSREGWNIDLRYTYSRADVLRSGADKITVNPTDPAYAGLEVENQRTINQSVTATLDYNSGNNWNVMIQLPYVMRDHTHLIGDPSPANVSGESFNANAIGDTKVIGHYRWNMDEAGFKSAGIKLGLKLATGRKDFQKMDATGAAIGIPDEVTLQPGNGSIDVIVGIFLNNNTPGSDFSWFMLTSSQSSISSSSNFRPGNQYNVDVGTRYAFTHDLNGLLQLNGQLNESDTGISAAVSPVTGNASSGGKSYSLTPGISYALTANTQVYGLLQLPFYQYVNGEQLTPDSTLSLGITQRF